MINYKTTHEIDMMARAGSVLEDVTEALKEAIRPGIRTIDLDRLAKAAKDAGAQYFGGGVLFLMPSAQKVFFPFLRERFPHLLRRYEERFLKSPYLRGPYTDELRQRVRKIRDRYGLASAPVDYRPELWEDERQQELFPINS